MTKDNEYLFVNSEADYDVVIGTNRALGETLEPYNVEELYNNSNPKAAGSKIHIISASYFS